MRYSGLNIVFQEIPNEISLAFQVVGCPLRCLECHSSDLWRPGQGLELSQSVFEQLLAKNRTYISCVLFLGGEWLEAELLVYLQMAKKMGLKTALYTGLDLDQVSRALRSNLTYLKYGPYIKELGALGSARTNQRLINLETNENLNHYFSNEGEIYDSIR